MRVCRCAYVRSDSRKLLPFGWHAARCECRASTLEWRGVPSGFPLCLINLIWKFIFLFESNLQTERSGGVGVETFVITLYHYCTVYIIILLLLFSTNVICCFQQMWFAVFNKCIVDFNKCLTDLLFSTNVPYSWFGLPYSLLNFSRLKSITG